MIRSVSVGAIAMLFGLTSMAGAQTFEHLAVLLEGRSIGIRGGEQPNVFMSSGPLVIGTMTTAAFSKLPNMCGFGVSGRIDPSALSAWWVEATPTKVDGDTVSVHLKWRRSRDEGKESAGPRGELDVTLKRGESMPLDMVAVPLSSTYAYERCGVRAVAIRASVVSWPMAQDDRRLLSTDLWLIERLPNGTEHSQPLTVRGLYGQPTPFYFDTITDGDTLLDFFGEFVATPENGSIVMKLQTRTRLTARGESTISMRVPFGPGNMFTARKVESTIKLGVNDVVAVELPRLNENETGAFANHTFSIRVRSRQIR